MNDPKNRAEVTSIVKESLKVSDEIAREIFAPYLEPDKNVLPKKRRIELESIQSGASAHGRRRGHPDAGPSRGALHRS